jgi:hypothetical protein
MWLIGSRARPVAGLALLLVAGAVGCNRGSLPEQSSPERARAALEQALEAWKKGESLDDLAAGEPKVYFNDTKAAVLQLVEYRIEDDQRFHGQSVRLGAVLTLKEKEGGIKQRKTGYLIDTGRDIVIVPE